jgi:uncharacterized protein YaaN involved in tellurite resistance
MTEMEPAAKPVSRDEAIAAIAQGIDLADRSAVASYGHGAQRKLAEYADQVLSHARGRPTGATNELLGNLIETASGLDANSIRNGNLFERLFSTVEARLKRFVGRFETSANKVEMVAVQLENHRDQLLKDIALLDTLFDETRDAIAALELYIAAGKRYIAQSPSIVADGSELDIQDQHDRRMALSRLEKRLLQLEQARQVGLQQLPQIRVVQASDETLVDNLQSAVTLTIPVWKQKMLLLLGLSNQEAALKLHDAVVDATNKMIEQASSMTRDQAIRIEQSSQTGILDVAVLERTNRELIETITKVIEIQTEGAAARAALENRLELMNGELRASLSGLGSGEPGNGSKGESRVPVLTAEPAAANG